MSSLPGHWRLLQPKRDVSYVALRGFRPGTGRLIECMTCGDVEKHKGEGRDSRPARRYLAGITRGPPLVIPHKCRKHDSGSDRFGVGKKRFGRRDTTVRGETAVCPYKSRTDMGRGGGRRWKGEKGESGGAKLIPAPRRGAN